MAAQLATLCRDEFVERADQHRHDLERAAVAKQVLQKQDLELDRVLAPMCQFVGEQVGFVSRPSAV